MRGRVLPICLGTLVVIAALAVSIGPAAATRPGSRPNADPFSAAARAAVSKLFSSFPHVVGPARPGGCSVSSGLCVQGCALPVTAGDGSRLAPSSNCDGAVAKPCMLPVAGAAAPPPASGQAPPCGSAGLRLLRSAPSPPGGRRR